MLLNASGRGRKLFGRLSGCGVCDERSLRSIQIHLERHLPCYFESLEKSLLQYIMRRNAAPAPDRMIYINGSHCWRDAAPKTLFSQNWCKVQMWRQKEVSTHYDSANSVTK